ncbi:hypothetical protein [Chromobacterium sp. CV08]|uniref:hypothetical protein n=1 Tax=Chromobacterium sp. CV08 TaxID=3133274 RepID=UPI003DA8C2A8
MRIVPFCRSGPDQAAATIDPTRISEQECLDLSGELMRAGAITLGQRAALLLPAASHLFDILHGEARGERFDLLAGMRAAIARYRAQGRDEQAGEAEQALAALLRHWDASAEPLAADGVPLTA